ncbi:sugar ABC transporter ATP-binding protein [Candidatus Cryosericum hinesii]|uniref:Sugar ABC transporter ATP-binding protein n=2 Tax=Candidatus Cryosericum TaxID=2498709 RepID=A0A398DGS6_9BACT|nr:sugar ABC transporter ATP-binding protein [Candidatus Cryosericum hinesii]RIE09108.1 sugar ABC transporter ATP-binding protein [Candidatus Cryosericum hinesii]RIE11715.1 sugar ABC transporter ATP-binding protein [Candidatus Cryosericum hinesii]RIE12939.1 sugar ABC transporter ATP-binding protein [Candidatus Cryosericum hinesii]
MNEVLISAKGICKDYSGVRVLDHVDVDGVPGQVHGIIGENGAGKSTLMNILAGFAQPTEGSVVFQGKPVVIAGPIAAKEMGISMIHQELNLIPDLTVYENIFLGKELVRAGGLLDKKAMIVETRSLLAKVGESSTDPRASIASLSVAKKQMVEIAKALSNDSKVLIMDEPTAVLTDNEIEILFASIRQLKEKGVTIFYISHRLKEVKQICDTVTVLRDGRRISTNNACDVAEEDMARLMVGRELQELYPAKAVPGEDVVLDVQNLSIPGVIQDVSFQLRKGEILGFSGLVGSGRTELMEALVGLRHKTPGCSITVMGKQVGLNQYDEAIRHHIVYLPEDRKRTGLIVDMNITENITIVSLGKYCHPFVDRKAEGRTAAKYVQAFDIRCKSITELVRYLSGGNQQKVALAKAMEVEPEIVILDEPTRGIDINTKQMIYRFINDLARQGKSCIVISSELPEIVGMCDHVAVMRGGQLAGFVQGKDVNEEDIMFLATGLKKGVPAHAC